MMDEAEAGKSTRSRWRRRVTVASGLITLLAAAVVLPPLVNINRYQPRIAALMTSSIGRSVRMSSVELRLLPRPGFVLHDLAVSEDSGFGAEPILSARTVVASVRLVSLWRGRLEVSGVSVDEASLNLVRSAQGRWNLESLLMGARPSLTAGLSLPAGGNASASPGDGSARDTAWSSSRFPYLEATDSRVNLKNGVEKSPFSLVGTDLSLWQDEPGVWRVRLRGQPVRTDLEMTPADAGEVRMEATLRSAQQLREMPLKLQMEWRDAQLGQLSRLLTGSDAGWRGDLTADIEAEGTPENTQTKARLRATGVRRQEFAPETPLDFDANCSLRYQHSQNAIHAMDCNTAIGNGWLHLKADLPGNGATPEAVLELNRIPAQAGLDLLRTVRGGFAPGITAKGTAAGNLEYKEMVPRETGQSAAQPVRSLRSRRAATVRDEAVPRNLHGEIVLDGVVFAGGGLTQPLTLPRISWTPETASAIGQGDAGVGASFNIPLAPAVRSQPVASQPGASSRAAAAQSISVAVVLHADGYRATIGGSAEIARLRDLAYAFGLPRLDAVDSFAAGTADFDLAASGPWIVSGIASREPAEPAGTSESLSGSLQLHRAQWKPAYLALPVDLPQAAVAFAPAGIDFSADFTYGGAKSLQSGLGDDANRGQIRGSVRLSAVQSCLSGMGGDSESAPSTGAAGCEPKVELRLGALDGDALEAALLGAPAEKSLLSPLLDRFRSSGHPKWPTLTVTAQAESLRLGPATLQKPLARLRFKENDVAIEQWQADLLGGSANGTGSFGWSAGKSGDRPQYSFTGNFTRLNATLLGGLLGSRWTGGPISGSASIELAGFTALDLAASASGDLRFDWCHGTIATGSKNAADTRFEDWSGVAALQSGYLKIGENAMIPIMVPVHGGKSSGGVTVAGTIPFGGPVELTVTPTPAAIAASAGHSAAKLAVK